MNIPGPGHVLRLVHIHRALVLHGLDELIFHTPGLRRFRLLLFLLPWNWVRSVPEGSVAKRIRNLLEDLGPIYIKLGQLLSTRRDMFSQEIADEFSKLRDQVPPFPGSEARKIIEHACGKKLEEVFVEFQDQPIASASIAQVHAAKLHDGRLVAVKVVRLGIRKQIEYDLDFMYLLAHIIERYWATAKHLKLTKVIRQFHQILTQELDMIREAANASQLKHNFADSDNLYIPEVVWEFTYSDVLVMERIEGICVDDKEKLLEAGYDLRKIAETGIELFFAQVFRDSFFHADLHPGNIFVTQKEDGEMRITLVDFGIMSSLSEHDQRYLAENFIAFMDRDYQRVAKLHVESGWVPPDTLEQDFEAAIRTVCEPMFDRPLREISFGDLLLRLFQTARSFNMEILPQLLLLQKTLVNVEGLSRYICPELDLWASARPVLDRWLRQRIGFSGLFHGVRKDMPMWLDRLPRLPLRTANIIDRLSAGKLEISVKGVEPGAHELSSRSTVAIVIGTSVLVNVFLFLFWSGAPLSPAFLLISLAGLLLIFYGQRR